MLYGIIMIYRLPIYYYKVEFEFIDNYYIYMYIVLFLEKKEKSQ